jgi:carbonic anhydrase
VNKDTYVKGGLVALIAFVAMRGNAATSTGQQALAEAQASKAEVTALRAELGLTEASPGATTTTGHGAGAASAAAHGADGPTTTTPAKTVGAAAKATPTTAAVAVHWSYGGATGPSKWGKLETDYATCADGTKQSPIDITNAKVANLPDLTINYPPETGSVINNGHTIQVDLAAGATLGLNGLTYNLAQFHFHGPSEHKIGGKQYPLEVHLVHKDSTGRLVVIGVLVSEGSANPAFDSMIASLPTTDGVAAPVSTPFDLATMLPAVRATYRYDGSLTTPPCTEGVSWNVMAQPITMSAAQIKAITSKLHEENDRPTQKIGTREVVLDVTVGAVTG